jgi:hypothetical protein
VVLAPLPLQPLVAPLAYRFLTFQTNLQTFF